MKTTHNQSQPILCTQGKNLIENVGLFPFWPIKATHKWSGKTGNIWTSVMVHGPRFARYVCHDLEPNIFPSGPPTQSTSAYY